MDIDTSTAEALKRANIIRGLHALAAFLEAHPDVPAPWGVQVDVFVAEKNELAAIARLTAWQKEYRDTWFSLHKAFSETVTLEVNIERDKVCRRVVTGTRVVAAQPERVVEEFEWKCEDAILSEDK